MKWFERVARLLGWNSSDDNVQKEDLKYRHVLITIHGFGKKRSQEMKYIKEWGEAEGWHVVVFDLFGAEIESVPAFERWMENARAKIDEYISQGYIVNLLGFSMGGVIASQLAVEKKIRRLVLLAPAFDYLSLESASRLIAMSATSVLQDSEQKFIKDLRARILPPEYFPQFVDLVRKYRNAIDEVQCPVLLIHGSADETIPVRSSKLAYSHIKHAHKQLFVLEGGSHQLMLDPLVRWEVFVLIRLFLEEEIVKADNFAYNISEQQIDDEE